jgi:dihydrolipoamide dehydrogenase
MKSYHAVVIGSGPGGYPCAIRLGQLGLKVACIERDQPGGVCLNWGCIPSKALIHAAGEYARIRAGAAPGIAVGSVALDPGAMQDWKDGIVKRLGGGVRALLKGAGVDYLGGTARLVAADAVAVTSPDGTTERLAASKAVVLATGASPSELAALPRDGVRIIGAKEAVSLRQVPKRLLVVGGGAIGLELGTVYQKLGAELTVVEALPQLLTGLDPDCVRLVERRLTKSGARIFKQAFARSCAPLADGSLVVGLEQQDKSLTVTTDVVLVAIGMRPATGGLGLEALGIRLDERGFVVTDARGQTSMPGVYAVGDVSGPPLCAHKASKEGELVAEVIAGHDVSRHWRAIPSATFTDPEIAAVGLTAEQAAAQGMTVKVGRFPFAALGKAMAIGETEGFVKVVSDASSGRILGVHIVGPEASTMVSEAVLALQLAATAADVARAVHPHPTLGEALMEAAAHAIGRAIHVPNR